MKTVAAFVLSKGITHIKAPRGAKVLSVTFTSADPVVWALIDTQVTELVHRKVHQFEMGAPIAQEVLNTCDYVGVAVSQPLPFLATIRHIFIERETPWMK